MCVGRGVDMVGYIVSTVFCCRAGSLSAHTVAAGAALAEALGLDPFPSRTLD